MSLPARTGWQWFKAGFGLFRTQPGSLTILLFTNLLASLLLSAVPIAGPMLTMVLIPSFSMAVLQACAEIDHGKRTGLSVLATGFRMPGVVALCKLGLVYLAISIILTLLTHSTVNPGFLQQVAGPIDPNRPPTLAASDVLAMLGILTLQSLALILLSFAAPLTHWQKMAPFKASFYSVFAVLGAKRAFATLLLSWFGLFFAVFMVVTAILGGGNAARVLVVWIVLLFVLLLQCALYAAYRQIFGMPDVTLSSESGTP